MTVKGLKHSQNHETQDTVGRCRAANQSWKRKRWPKTVGDNGRNRTPKQYKPPRKMKITIASNYKTMRNDRHDKLSGPNTSWKLRDIKSRVGRLLILIRRTGSTAITAKSTPRNEGCRTRWYAVFQSCIKDGAGRWASHDNWVVSHIRVTRFVL